MTDSNGSSSLSLDLQKIAEFRYISCQTSHSTGCITGKPTRNRASNRKFITENVGPHCHRLLFEINDMQFCWIWLYFIAFRWFEQFWVPMKSNVMSFHHIRISFLKVFYTSQSTCHIWHVPCKVIQAEPISKVWLQLGKAKWLEKHPKHFQNLCRDATRHFPLLLFYSRLSSQEDQSQGALCQSWQNTTIRPPNTSSRLLGNPGSLHKNAMTSYVIMKSGEQNQNTSRKEWYFYTVLPQGTSFSNWGCEIEAKEKTLCTFSHQF